MSKAQQDYKELQNQQRGPHTVAGPPNSMLGTTTATLDVNVPE